MAAPIIDEHLMHWLTMCGAPFATFILGLFFPQVKFGHLLDALRPTHTHTKE